LNKLSHKECFRSALLRWYSTHGRELPWRKTRDPYSILVSEVMLQQTQVGTVRTFYRKWLERFPNFAALAAATETEVLHAWQGLGYYTRARNLHAAAKAVVSRHKRTLPHDPKLIRELPGIGRYTANAVVTFAFDQPVPIVEANTTRVLARLFNIDVPVDSAVGRERLWKSAAALVPTTDPGRFNSALLDLGALICVRRKPKCGICPVKAFCRARRPELLPIKKARPQTEWLTESHAFVRRHGDLLLEHCSSRWRGMWMLPSLPSIGKKTMRPVHTSLFPFTNHRISLRVFRGCRSRIDAKRHRWFPITQLDAVPIPSPHRRAIVALLGTLNVEPLPVRLGPLRVEL
jgi:A/G-specific adenine glycosylase